MTKIITVEIVVTWFTVDIKSRDGKKIGVGMQRNKNGQIKCDLYQL